MTSAAHPVADPAVPGGAAWCCRRPMSTISVRQAQGSVLALHSCGRCGRHQWQRDGEPLDRLALLEAVRDRVTRGTAPRPAARATLDEVRDRLAAFSVLGS